MLSRDLEQTLNRSLSLASERGHPYATLEHLLLGLADDPDASLVLKACGIDLDKLHRDLGEFLDKDLAGLAVDQPGDPKPTAGFQRVVQRAAIHVQQSGRDLVTGANVLVALFSERESHAVYFLQLQDMTRLDAINFISHGIAKVPNPGTRVLGSQVDGHDRRKTEPVRTQPLHSRSNTSAPMH
jgi:ATP-dependent Clp protease ATP-binding subunit ClpA